jgi:hypothetical protein
MMKCTVSLALMERYTDPLFYQLHWPRGLMAKALDFGLHLLNTLEIPGSTPGVVALR